MYEMSLFDFILNFVLTIIGYMGFPFYKFYFSKENYDLEFKKKIIFWNSVFAALLFILLRLFFFGYNNTTINFVPAFFYYILNSILYTRKKDNDIENTIDEFDNELDESINIIQQTINNAKINLKTGIKKEQLDKMLENGYITLQSYNEILESIKSLEMLASFDIDELKNNIPNNKNNYDIEFNENDEYDEDLEDMYSNDEEK
jgi:hypothetical protein